MQELETFVKLINSTYLQIANIEQFEVKALNSYLLLVFIDKKNDPAVVRLFI